MHASVVTLMVVTPAADVRIL